MLLRVVLPNAYRLGSLCLGNLYVASLGIKSLQVAVWEYHKLLHLFATQTWGSQEISAYQRQKTSGCTFLKQNFLL
jgi:hypothetical protein